MHTERTGGCNCGCGSKSHKDCKCPLNCSCRSGERGGGGGRRKGGPRGNCCGLIGLSQETKILELALWDEHVFWTREVAASILLQLPGLQAALDTLLENQRKIANTFIRKFGNQVADTVHSLLREHIEIAGKVVSSLLLKNNDTETKRLLEEWSMNGRQIADALHGLDPLLASKAAWRRHLQTHLDLTTQEAVNYHTKNYHESQRYFMSALEQARMMAFLIAQLVS